MAGYDRLVKSIRARLKDQPGGTLFVRAEDLAENIHVTRRRVYFLMRLLKQDETFVIGAEAGVGYQIKMRKAPTCGT